MDLDEIRNLKEPIEQSEKRCLEAEEALRDLKKPRLESEKRCSEAEQKLKLLKLNEFKSLSYFQVYQSFLNSGKITECENLGLSQVNISELTTAWKASLAGLTEFKDGRNEKEEVHPLLKITLESIFKTFGLYKIKSHHDSRLHMPVLCPDFTITSNRIAEPAWLDCLTFIECMSTDIPMSEGAGQAISYLSHLLFPGLMSLSELNVKDLYFSIQTNGRKIQFFALKKTGEYECENLYSSEFSLFDENASSSEPSKGFILLCQFMSYLNNSWIPANSVRVNGKVYNVIKTLHKYEAIVVGIIDLGGDEGRCVAKCLIHLDIPAMFTIQKEARMYEILEDSPVRTLKLSRQSSSNHLIFRDVAKNDLRSWSYEILYEIQEEEDLKFSTIIKYFIKIFDQIQALHEFGYTHCDIKPANVVILEDDAPCLIDLVTMTKIGETLDFLQGTLLYIAEDLLCNHKSYVNLKKYDLESFFYSLLDCADIHYSTSFLRSCVDAIEITNDNPNDYEKMFAESRKNRLNNLRKSNSLDHFGNPKFVELFFKLFDKLHEIENDLESNDYVAFKQIFESFL